MRKLGRVMMKGNIKQLRKNAGLTQEQLGLKMGVTKQAVSGWERTGALPRDKWEDLAKALKVDVIDLDVVCNSDNLHIQVAEAIEMSGLSKKQFTKAIGATNYRMNGWLKQNGRKPHTRYIEKMADLIGVTVEEFFQLGL